MIKIKTQLQQICLTVASALVLSACGGSNNNNQSSETTPTNPSSPTTPTTPTQIECVNGIPKNLKTAGSGFFNEEIFSLESDANDQGKDSLVFYTNTIIDSVVYQNLTTFIKNGPSKYDITNYTPYMLTRSRLNTSFKQSFTSSGFPIGYMISQDQNSELLNQFNDQCTINTENQIKAHLKQIDISGMTVSDLFKYYEYPKSGNPERYLASNIANILDNNDTDSLNKLLQDKTKFPAGAKIAYYDQSFTLSDNFGFSDDNVTTYETLDEFKIAIKLPSGYVWKNDQFAGLNVVYPINSSTNKVYPFTNGLSAIEMNGKIYESDLIPEGDLIKIQMDPSETNVDMSETFFNKIAMQTFAEAVNKAQQ